MLGPPIPQIAQEARLAVLQQQQLQTQLRALSQGIPSVGMRPPTTALELAALKNMTPGVPFEKRSSTLPFGSPEWAAAVAAEREAEQAVGGYGGFGYGGFGGGVAPAPAFDWPPPPPAAPAAPAVGFETLTLVPAAVAGQFVWWAVRMAAGGIVAYETVEAWKDYKARGLQAMKGKLEYDVHNNHMLIRFQDGRTALAPRKYQPW